MGFFDSIYKMLKNKSIDKKNNFIGNEQINLNKLANVRKGLVHEYTEKDILVSIKNLAMQNIKDQYKICVWGIEKSYSKCEEFYDTNIWVDFQFLTRKYYGLTYQEIWSIIKNNKYIIDQIAEYWVQNLGGYPVFNEISSNITHKYNEINRDGYAQKTSFLYVTITVTLKYKDRYK